MVQFPYVSCCVDAVVVAVTSLDCFSVLFVGELARLVFVLCALDGQLGGELRVALKCQHALRLVEALAVGFLRVAPVLVARRDLLYVV